MPNHFLVLTGTHYIFLKNETTPPNLQGVNYLHEYFSTNKRGWSTQDTQIPPPYVCEKRTGMVSQQQKQNRAVTSGRSNVISHNTQILTPYFPERHTRTHSGISLVYAKADSKNGALTLRNPVHDANKKCHVLIQDMAVCGGRGGECV